MELETPPLIYRISSFTLLREGMHVILPSSLKQNVLQVTWIEFTSFMRFDIVFISIAIMAELKSNLLMLEIWYLVGHHAN